MHPAGTAEMFVQGFDAAGYSRFVHSDSLVLVPCRGFCVQAEPYQKPGPLSRRVSGFHYDLDFEDP